MTPRDLIDDLRSRINPAYAATLGTESYERRLCAEALEAQADEIERLQHEADFYRRRCELLQRWQSSMREPERTLVCDVLANGQTLPPEIAGDRYGTMAPNAGSNGPSGVAAKVRVD